MKVRHLSHATVLLVLLHVLVVALLIGCGKEGTKVAVSEMTATTNAQGVQEVDVDVHSFYFKPSRIIVQSGRPADITLHFRSFFVPHNLTLTDAASGYAGTVGAGFMSFKRTKHIRFTPKTPGEYEFFCHVGNHHKKGMEGTLVVR